MKMLILRIAVLPLLVWLQACAQDTVSLSPQAEVIYQNYLQLNEWNPQRQDLDRWLGQIQVELTALQAGLLQPEPEPEIAAAISHLHSWQNEIMLFRSEKMQELQRRAKSLSIVEEKTYLLALIGYWGYNILLAPLNSKVQLQSLLHLKNSLQPLIDTGYRRSEVHRLYAEICSRLMAYQPKEIIRLSQLSKTHAERAIALDRKNGAAYLSLGSWYLYAPPFAGGSPSQAVKLFQKAEKLPLNSSEKVLLYEFKAKAYDKSQNFQQALQVVEQGLSLAPLYLNLLQARQSLLAGRSINEG